MKMAFGTSRTTKPARLTARGIAAIALSFRTTAIAQCPDTKGDPRVQIISPHEGQQFAPGDTVNVSVRSTVPLAAGYLAAGVPGAGVLVGEGFDGSTYHAHFVIPADYARTGPLALSPDVIDATGHPVSGACLTIVVRRTETPLSLSPANALEYIFAIGQKKRVFVTGRYPGESEGDLTSSTTGTRYASSDTHIVTVDAEGNVESTGLGTATVTATNGGSRTSVVFVVEDPADPLPPQDLTALVSIAKSPLGLDEGATASYKWPVHVQTITVTNTSRLPIVGPLYLTVTDLSVDVRLYGGPNVPGARVLYLRLQPKDGLTIHPDESATRLLRFVMPRSSAAPNYRIGLVRSRADPQKLTVIR